jgi:N-acetylneuraminate lyase
MNHLRELKGIFPATVTPFGRDGGFDPQAMRRIVRHQVDAGVHGLYVCGGTGEGLLMTVEERKEAIETVLDEVAGQATVIAHIGAFRTDEMVVLARHAGEAGADAIAALPPAYFYRPDEEGLVRYYAEVADASDLRMLIYNIPARTGIAMTESLFERFLALDNIVGMKDSSGDIYSLGHFLTIGDEPVIFEGEDTVLFPAMLAGANGGIGATHNIMPQLFMRLWDALQAKDTVHCLQG